MKLSIVIAAYNVEKYIEKCLLSCIQNAGSFEYEVVVVNDGSTDDTAGILTRLASENPIIKIVNQSNSGLGAARNTGLQNAIGAYVWCIDGDDYLDPNAILSILQDIESKQLDTLILNYAVVDEQYQVVSNHNNRPQNVEGVFTGEDYYETNYSKSYTWLFVFKRSLFVENNIIFKERINMQDSEILPKLLLHADRIAFLDKICYYYLQQPESFTNSAKGEKRYKYFESIIAVRDSLQDFLSTVELENPKIASGIKKKLSSFHHIVYNHLVYLPYEKEWLIKIIGLLKLHTFYPLQYNGNAKSKIIVALMNVIPVSTKKIIDTLRKK